MLIALNCGVINFRKDKLLTIQRVEHDQFSKTQTSDESYYHILASFN